MASVSSRRPLTRWMNPRCPDRRSPPHPTCPLLFSQQADERYRKNVQGSPQSAQTKPPQPPVPPRSESSYPNGSSASEAPAMHRPVEPQVNVATSLVRRGGPPSLARRRMASFCTKTLKPNVLHQMMTVVSFDMWQVSVSVVQITILDVAVILNWFQLKTINTVEELILSDQCKICMHSFVLLISAK